MRTRRHVLFAAHPKLLTPVLRIVHRHITRFLLKQLGLKRGAADAGSVTLIQRFGSAANVNIHLHGLVLDSVYRRTVEMMQLGAMSGSQSRRDTEILTEPRAIDRSKHWRYSGS